MLEKNNPGTITTIHVDLNNQFKYCFWAYGASITGFRVIRPVIAIDATHLKGRFKGVLFVAVAKDATESAYPLAFGIGHKEDDETWTWFLSQLRGSYGCPTEMMLVSDQHLGIKTACAKVFPDAAHGYCGYHLGKNLRNKVKRDDIVKIFALARDSYKRTDFARHMDHLKNSSPRAHDWLMSIGPHRWSRAMSPRRRYRLMTSNVAECINACLKHARKLPITVLVEFIRGMMQRWFYERREAANLSTNFLAEVPNKEVMKNVNAAHHMQVKPISGHEYEVQDYNKQVVVDLLAHTCSCAEFQTNLLPCKHAAAAIM